MNSRKLKMKRIKLSNLPILLIMSLGAFLRLINLGNDSLWNDEVGVVNVALSGSISSVLVGVRSHAAAMPLDYITTWIIKNVSLSETILRLPAAIFGTLSILMCYEFYLNIVDNTKATTATLLVAISPLLIHQSQELRFYSALLFFYYTSIIFLLRSLFYRNLRNYLLYIGITSLGIYYHIYVALSVLFFSLIIFDSKKHKDGLKKIIISIIIILILCLPGYIFYIMGENFDYPLLLWDNNIYEVIARGVGWLELPYRENFSLSWFWYRTVFIITTIGIIRSYLEKEYKILFLGMIFLFQVFIIIFTSWLKGYWFSYRQISFLMPCTFLFTSKGIEYICNKILNMLSSQYCMRSYTHQIILVIITIFCIPAIIDYYNWDKSSASKICKIISNQWKTSDIVYIIPSYSSKIYFYYFKYVLNEDNIANSIKEIDNINKTNLSKHTAYIVIINTNQTIDNLKYIFHNGFYPILISKNWLGHSLLTNKYYLSGR